MRITNEWLGNVTEPDRTHRLGASTTTGPTSSSPTSRRRSQSWRAGRSSIRPTRSVRVSTSTAATRTTSTRSPSIADAIYGVGVQWHPTARTNVVAQLGAPVLRLVVSVHVRSPHAAVRRQRRRPRATSRAIRSSSCTLPADRQRRRCCWTSSLASRIPDPRSAQQRSSTQIITERGLPTSL